MAIATYLAMTASQIQAMSPLPPKSAWMACSFSLNNRGLSNLPRQLPQGSLILVNDSVAMADHDPEWIALQLESLCKRFSCNGVVLDFQRPGICQQAQLVKLLCRVLPCPVAATEDYWNIGDGPVFVPPVPLTTTPEDYLKKWNNQEIWLEISPEARQIVLTADGAYTQEIPVPDSEMLPHRDERLFCRYKTETTDREAIFTLVRSGKEIGMLLSVAERLGVTKAIGLYQELKF